MKVEVDFMLKETCDECGVRTLVNSIKLYGRAVRIVLCRPCTAELKGLLII